MSLDDDAELRRAVILEEFKSLRSESAQAKNNQQSILQWSLAAAGVIVAAAIAVTRPVTGLDTSVGFTATAVAFATVLPLIFATAFAVWIGEVDRMERVGRYVRAREAAFAGSSLAGVDPDEAIATLPAVWENMIYSDEAKHDYGKNQFGSAAVCAMYALLLFASLLLAVLIAWTGPEQFPAGLTGQVLISVWSGVILLALAWVFYQRLSRVRRGSSGNVFTSKAGVDVAETNHEIALVLPCLNEQLALPWILSRTPKEYSVILVDNGSTDESLSIAARGGISIHSERQKGVGAASKLGVTSSSADVVCIIDCDGTVDPRDLKALIEPILSNRADLVVGARAATPGSFSPVHRSLSMCRTHLVRWALRIDVEDLGSARAIRREVFSSGMESLSSGNAWSLDLSIDALRRGLQTEVVWIPYYPRLGKSKITGTFPGSLSVVVDSLRVVRRARRATKGTMSELQPVTTPHAESPEGQI